MILEKQAREKLLEKALLLNEQYKSYYMRIKALNEEIKSLREYRDNLKKKMDECVIEPSKELLIEITKNA